MNRINKEALKKAANNHKQLVGQWKDCLVLIILSSEFLKPFRNYSRWDYSYHQNDNSDTELS